MEIEYLRTFCTTVELGSMVKAAEALAMSQPAVSHEIRAVESHLGVRLLDRTPDGVVATEDGNIAYREFSTILQTCGRLHGRIFGRQAHGNATVRVGTSAFPGGYILPSTLRAFTDRHPGITVTLRVLSVPEIMTMLMEGHLDLAILDARPEQQDFHFQVIGADPAMVVAGAGMADADQALDLKEWVEKPHVLCADRCLSLSISAFLASRRLDAGRFRVVASVETLEAAKSLVKEGLGLGVFPARAVRDDIRAEVLHEVPVRGWNLTVPLFEVHARRSVLTPVVLDLIEQVRRLLAAGPSRANGRHAPERCVAR